MNAREEVSRGLVVAGGNGTELLEPGEEIFNQMARLVEFTVIVARELAALFRGITAIFPAAANGWITRFSASNALSAISASACSWGSR